MVHLRYHGEELTKDELQEIYSKLSYTNHVMERLSERQDVNIEELFKNPVLAYFNTDGSVNIAKDEYNYLVCAYSEDYDNWRAITWKEKSHNNITIFQKQEFAKNGYDRKEYQK